LVVWLRRQPIFVALMNDDIDSVGGKNITAMTLWSWHPGKNTTVSRFRKVVGDLRAVVRG
jgi:hypothetical protein